ncbi:MAG: hypothetical protein A2289_22965 [Deltaproteobacteria bacterium RIFOXYA12_FULL_58_15]|nr:MAG: hypothetical protein A2289_22965 [Deltaproteobacteria bacterium RIFOXYA12_FULL_58_15]OGR08866.1 MAG: hypothetical protein A2341_27700 [Deltaproteobacteria bacterium RIFOXYB12_FULL_58_9]
MASAALSAENVSLPFEKYVLESNGLEVILSPDHDLPIVAVNIWYHAGPINEAPGRTGFAHLFEHLMFQGSKHVGDDQHVAILSAAGASEINGTTSNDRTNYFATMPANQLELTLWIEADRMGFLFDTLTQEKLDNQRDVVKNERRQSRENRPYGPSDEKMVHTLYPSDHPYYGDVIGSMADLEAATLHDVQEFYLRYYAPANATLTLVGDFEVERAKALIERYFGTLPRRDAPTKRTIETPPIAEERRSTVEEPVALPRIDMGWFSAPAYAPGDAECDVLAFILGAGNSSRLHRRLVYDLEIAQSVEASQNSMAVNSEFHVTVLGRPGVDLGRLEAEIQKVIDEIRQSPPSDKEVQRAKNQLLTLTISQLQLAGGFGGRADLLNRYNQYTGAPGHLAADLARYEEVTPMAVANLAKSLLDNKNRAVVVTVPKK